MSCRIYCQWSYLPNTADRQKSNNPAEYLKHIFKKQACLKGKTLKCKDNKPFNPA